MSDYFTADWHLGHHNIIGYTGRPFASVKEMNACIKSNAVSVLRDDDTLYVLGDIAVWYNIDLKELERAIRKIPGHKILILGNHDHLSAFDYVEMGFDSVHTHLYHERLNVHLTHDPANANVLSSQLWLCGHVHALFKETRNVLNVGVDVWDFKPVHENDIKVWVNKKRSD